MTTLPLNIRVCERRDLRALEWNGLFTHHREIFERTFEEQRGGAQVMLVGELGAQLVGQIWIDLHAAAARSTAVLWALRVHPEWEGRGIGTRLVAAAEQVALAHHRRRTELVVEIDNHRAQALYRRLGYTVGRPIAQTYDYTTPDGAYRQHHMNFFEMWKELQPPCTAHP